MINVKNKFIVIGVCAILFGGCSERQPLHPGDVASNHNAVSGQEVIVQEVVRTAPGVVEYTWEEPMVDVIEVPPGLSPDGVYWRPAHQSIVEIRQGRWKYHKPKR